MNRRQLLTSILGIGGATSVAKAKLPEPPTEGEYSRLYSQGVSDVVTSEQAMEFAQAVERFAESTRAINDAVSGFNVNA